MLIQHYVVSKLIVLLMGLVIIAQANADLIGRWHFDEPAGTVAADSLSLNDGNLAGDAAFVAGGISGNAVSMSKAGGGFVNFGDIFPLTSGDFTIILWAKTAPADQQADMFLLANQLTGILNGYVIAINTSGGYGQTDKAWFYMSNNSGDELVSNSSVNDGNWHQIAAVYVDGGQAEIYVDGGSAEATGPANPIIEGQGDFHVGGVTVGANSQSLFDGLVDELQMYDQALSETDIQFLFLHPSLSLGEFADGFEEIPDPL